MNFTKIQRELDYYKKFTPINYTGERIKFFEHVKKNEPYNPEFNYPDKLSVSDYKDFRVCLKKEMGKKENSYLLSAMEIIKLVEESKENYYKLSQGCFPLSALKRTLQQAAGNLHR